MRRPAVAAAVAAALAVAGCNDGGGFRLGSGRRSAGGRSDAEDANFSILLCVLTDPARHVQDAREYRKMLQERAGWRGLYIVDKAGHSALYWGKYPTVDAAQENLRAAKAYRPPSGVPLFAQAIIVPIAGEDIGPPEWNLKNAKGAYSLLVAVFKDDKERDYLGRRRRAVEFCTKLRNTGYQAYYHHGPGVSSVTIGTFQPNSVRVMWTRTGAQLDVLDTKIRKLQAEFRHLLVNGNTVTFLTRDPRTRKIIRREPRTTYLIRIPGSKNGDVFP